MKIERQKSFTSHGSGEYDVRRFKSVGENVVFEPGVLVFHEDTITIGDNVYIGHQTILKGYYNSSMSIGADSWIGQGCFFHSGGGIEIGRAVGIGPGVKILTSSHAHSAKELPVMHQPLSFKKVVIGDGSDIGVGAIILPGVTIGEGAVVGAGSVVVKDVAPYTVVAGNPARQISDRNA